MMGWQGWPGMCGTVTTLFGSRKRRETNMNTEKSSGTPVNEIVSETNLVHVLKSMAKDQGVVRIQRGDL